MDAKIPRRRLGTALQERSFLFDAIVDMNALGDAHGGGRAAWGGVVDSHMNSNHYTLLDLSATK